MTKSKKPLFVTFSVRSSALWVAVLTVFIVVIGIWAAYPDRSAQDSSPGSDPSQPLLEQPLSVTLPLTSYKIVVDAGHGGEDRGVCHEPEGLVESEINLDMAMRLKDALIAQGAEVFLTRSEDVYMSLDARAEAANQSGADILVSLHVNRIPGHPECFGAQTFYFPNSQEGKRLAETLQEELLKIDPENYRAPLTGSFKVLRLAKMPGALVEIGFLTNERDRQLIQGEEYRNKVTDAVVKGIMRYFEQPSGI